MGSTKNNKEPTKITTKPEIPAEIFSANTKS
jgi:hypothetical protein